MNNPVEHTDFTLKFPFTADFIKSYLRHKYNYVDKMELDFVFSSGINIGTTIREGEILGWIIPKGTSYKEHQPFVAPLSGKVIALHLPNRYQEKVDAWHDLITIRGHRDKKSVVEQEKLSRKMSADFYVECQEYRLDKLRPVHWIISAIVFFISVQLPTVVAWLLSTIAILYAVYYFGLGKLVEKNNEAYTESKQFFIR